MLGSAAVCACVFGCATAPAPSSQPRPVLSEPAASAPQFLPVPPSAFEASRRARPAFLDYALSLNGSRYRFGGSSPADGFDCSGFVLHVFARFGIALPRSASAMANQLPRVADRDRRAGDLVFFNTNGRPNSHVGIYLGGDRFIHATSRAGKTVKISNLQERYWNRRLEGLRRPDLAIADASALRSLTLGN